LKIDRVFLIGTIAISLALSKSLNVGIGGVSFDYREYSDGFELDSESSSYSDIGLIKISYNSILKDKNQKKSSLSFIGSYAEGDSEYEGYLQNLKTGELTPYKSSSDNRVVNLQIRYILEYDENSYSAGVFASGGYRDWVRDLKGIYGYKERYYWPYFQVGIMGHWYEEGFFTGFDIAYQRAINPRMHAYLQNRFDFDLGTTYGLNLVVPIGYKYKNGLSIGVNYEYDAWNINHSSIVDGFIEPDSKTKNKSIYLNIGYEF